MAKFKDAKINEKIAEGDVQMIVRRAKVSTQKIQQKKKNTTTQLLLIIFIITSASYIFEEANEIRHSSQRRHCSH